MSESVKPDGIKLNLADPCGLIPCTQSGMGYCDCSECKRKVYELSAQAQHLALTADLRQEIKDRNELYACLLDNKDTAFKDLMILHDKWKNETLKLRQEITRLKGMMLTPDESTKLHEGLDDYWIVNPENKALVTKLESYFGQSEEKL